MLDEFRSIDLKWNNAYERLGDVRTAQFDERGRKLVVQVTNDGDIVDLRGVELKLVTVDGIDVGGRNLLPTIFNLYSTEGTYGHIRILDEDEEAIFKLYEKDDSVDMSNIYFGFTRNGHGSVDGVKWAMAGGSFTSSLNDNLEMAGNNYQFFSYYPNNRETFDKIFKRFNIKVERGNKATDWTPAPEDLRFPFDLVDAQRGIYELYFPKLFVGNYTGNTKTFLELTTNEFSITSEPFYINVFDGVR